MSRDKFLAAIGASRARRSFTCPATGLEVEMRAPSYHDIAEAHATVDAAWKASGRDLTAVTLQALQDDRDVHVLGRITYHGGDLIGVDALSELPESAIEFYVDQMEQLRGESEVDVGDDDVDRMIGELKKKHGTSADILSTFGSAKLRAYVRRMASRLSS